MIDDDRFKAETYMDDETISIGLDNGGNPPEWFSQIPESLFARAQAIASGYSLHLFPVIDVHGETKLNQEQCKNLIEESCFIAAVVNDPLLDKYLQLISMVAEKCVRSSTKNVKLVLLGP